MVYTLETSWYDHTNIRIVDFHTCNIFMMKNGNIEKDVEINVSSLYYFHHSFPLLIFQSLDHSSIIRVATHTDMYFNLILVLS